MNDHSIKLLVRADVGPNVGTGHLMRMLSLGQAWSQAGGTVAFVCGHLPKGLVKRLATQPFQIHQTQHDACDEADIRNTLGIVDEFKPDWVALDGTQFNDRYQIDLKASALKPFRLLVVADQPHVTHPHADLVLQQNVACQIVPTIQTQVLAGSQFALPRDEAGIATSVPPPPQKHIVHVARRILVTLGGDDPDNWTLHTLQVLSDLNRTRLVVDCVLGAGYQHFAELERFKKTANMNLRIHRSVDRITPLMTRLDLAITARGAACHELARHGVPVIVFSMAEDQLPIARTLNDFRMDVVDDSQDDETHDEGLGNTAVGNIAVGDTAVGDAGNADSSLACRLSYLKRTIRRLINDPDRRQDMSFQGMQLVDGRGAQRVASQMEAKMMVFRKASIEDAQVLWQWRNDPEVRSVSFDTQPVPFEGVQDWLTHQMGDPHTTLWVTEDHRGSAVGQVQFEFSDDGCTALISIIVDQSRRGRGLGTVLIGDACRELFATTAIENIVAKFKPSNAASEKAFRAAGFTAIEPTIVNGKVALQYRLLRQSLNVGQSEIKKSA